MDRKLQIKRGAKAALPALAAGELALTTDEKTLYYGTGAENIPVARAAHSHTTADVGAHNADSDAHAGVLTKKYFFTVTLPASGWSATAPYKQTISVAGMRIEYDPIYYVKFVSYTDAYKKQCEEIQYISLLTTANGSITAQCDSTKPTVNITIKMKEVY